MRRIGVSIKESVENGRPADIPDKSKFQPFLAGEAMLLRQDWQAGIDQRQKTDCKSLAQLVPPINSCAVTTASAISTMRRLDCIALARNSP